MRFTCWLWFPVIGHTSNNVFIIQFNEYIWTGITVTKYTASSSGSVLKHQYYSLVFQRVLVVPVEPFTSGTRTLFFVIQIMLHVKRDVLTNNIIEAPTWKEWIGTECGVTLTLRTRSNHRKETYRINRSIIQSKWIYYSKKCSIIWVERFRCNEFVTTHNMSIWDQDNQKNVHHERENIWMQQKRR